jgi:putative membrane protein
VLAGVAFAAVNQALVAVFGGAGRWIGAIIGAFVVATGVVSTVPGVLTSIASVLPVQPAYAAMLGALTSAGGVTAGVATLVVWLLLSLVATTVVVSRRRTVSARAALA